MRFELPPNYCDLPSDQKDSLLKSAERALVDRKQVFFNGKQFTNQDELVVYLTEYCLSIATEPDMPGVES